METGLLILRLTVGLTLAAHGVQKLFGWFGGGGLAATAAAMEKLGFRPGRRNALLAGLAEAGGGVLLAAGLATPVAAATVFGVMLVAGASAHLRHGFFLKSGGFEYTLVLALSGLSAAFTGPGQLSLDVALGIERGGLRWGLAALLTGLVAGGIPLATRQSTKAELPAAARADAQKA
jgi:putative oxidoreductase